MCKRERFRIRIKRDPYRELYQLLWFLQNSFVCIGCRTTEVEKWRLCIIKCVIAHVGMFFKDMVVDCLILRGVRIIIGSYLVVHVNRREWVNEYKMEIMLLEYYVKKSYTFFKEMVVIWPCNFNFKEDRR